MSVVQTTAAGAARPVNARRVRGWVRGGAAVICGLCLFNTVGGDESGPLLDLARLTGLEAGYAVLAALLLMARIPALDRHVGSDQLAQLHAWVGRWIIGTAVAHTVLAILGYASLANRSIPGEIADLNTHYPDVLLATVALGLFLLVAVTSARAARKRLQYETWYLVHLYTYLAIALSFAHQFSTGTDFRYTDARVIWSAMYLTVVITLLRYRVFEPLRVNWRHRLRVLDVYPESPETVSVYLTGRALDRLDARPGQFFRWRFATRGDEDPLSAASLRRLLGDPRDHDIYLCGPPGMTASVRRALHELGVGDADIHEETFAF
jgi:predicted ferric reductase